jgi:hypothetical protein
VRKWTAAHTIRWLQWQASTSAVPLYEHLGLIGDTKSDLEEHPSYDIDFTRSASVKRN